MSNSLFCTVDFLTFSSVVNTQCQSNMASIKQIAYCAHIREKIIHILTEMGY